MIEGVSYNKNLGKFVLASPNLLNEMVNLYSNHYGTWSKKGIRPGNNIRLSAKKLEEWLKSDYVTVYYALLEDKTLIGYAIAFSKKEKDYGVITWVTQLVVHKEHRKKGIAERLLFSIWGFSDHYAWGIVSANPYAIRALEKATRRRTKTIRIKKNSKKLLSVGKLNIPFVHEDTILCVDEKQSVINTEFYVDHSDTVNMLNNVTKDDLPWELGYIDEGWEWFAFTFNDQPQIELSKEEILRMIETADEVVKKAYERMTNGWNENTQSWARHTFEEIEYISKRIDFKDISLAYDLGCGTGRHSIELAQRGINVIGIDYVPVNVQMANKKLADLKGKQQNEFANIKIEEADCRYYKNDIKAEMVLCLYDVIGSFATNQDNRNIIQTAYNLLNINGYAVFSVMNYDTTLARAKHKFIFDENPNKLLELLPSKIMETTGDVYNPDYYCVDTETHLVYRKERFDGGNDLPVELIIRDRRFTKEEIISLCKEVGFSIIEVKYTNASSWEEEYPPESERAKEILVICKKCE